MRFNRRQIVVALAAVAVAIVALVVALQAGDNAGTYPRSEVFEQTRIESGGLDVPSDDSPFVPDVVSTPEGCRGLLLTSEEAIEENPPRQNTIAVDNPDEPVRVLVFAGNRAGLDISPAECQGIFQAELDKLTGASGPRSASDCGYSVSFLARGQANRLAPERRRRLSQRQPSLLALNADGRGVCAYVHADNLLYLRGSNRALPADDGQIELRFEAPVREVEPVFPEGACGVARDLEQVDAVTWSFVLPEEVLEGSCFAVADHKRIPTFTFSIGTKYGRGDDFVGNRMSYGLTVSLPALASS